MRDGRLRRAERRVLLEGPHLVAAALAAGVKPIAMLGTQAALAKPEVASLVRQARLTPVMLSPAVFGAIADAETPPGIAAEIPLPDVQRPGPSVFLEGVQDAGNVGAIIRSAAAFGAGTVVVDRQCADPWSPKVLRAAMGGHFAIGIRQVDDLGAAIAAFGGRTICTVVHGGRRLRDADLSGRIAWAFGAEGAGLSPGLLARAAERVTIPMAGGESLNVAAAAAICLYEGFSRPAAGS
jgi:TrmH family RNA methyltransferase